MSSPVRKHATGELQHMLCHFCGISALTKVNMPHQRFWFRFQSSKHSIAEPELGLPFLASQYLQALMRAEAVEEALYIIINSKSGFYHQCMLRLLCTGCTGSYRK